METHPLGSRDLVRAPGLAWSIRKMHAAMIGFLAAWGIYFVFSYAALAASSARGGGLVAIFRTFEFFPYLLAPVAGVVSLTLWIAGIVAALCVILLTAVSVSVIAVEDLRGNLMFQTSEALRFMRAHRSTVLFTMGALTLLVLVFPAGFALAALVGRIPVIGELALAVLALPLFFWGLAGVAVIIVFLFGFNTVPAITAWTGKDVLETVLQAFSLVWSRPIRFLLLQIAARIITAISALLLGMLCFCALLLGVWVLAHVTGYKWNELFTIALCRIPGVMDSEYALRIIYALSVNLGTPLIVDTTAVSPTVRAAGWILGGSFLLTGLWIASFGFSVFYSAQAIIYRVLRPGKEEGGSPCTRDAAPDGTAVREKVESPRDTGPMAG